MNVIVSIMRTLAVALVLVLTATGLWAAGAEEEAPAAAADKRYVTDPTTGEPVVAPEYGGTITVPWNEEGPNPDVMLSGWYGMFTTGVLERLANGDWGIDRSEFSFKTAPPVSALTGELAESWSQPDIKTVIVKIRQGVHWHDKAPMNGRELDAYDVEYNFHRVTGTGSGFSEPSAFAWILKNFKWKSITAIDKWTVVFKLQEIRLDALGTILFDTAGQIYPPEVIKEHGDASDWRNLVGTGPFELTNYVEGTVVTYARNPNYWGYDEKYPQNRLPYVDEVRSPIMPEEATRIAALRSGKVDFLGYASVLRSVDQAESLERTNPEIELRTNLGASTGATGLNINKAPFDDIRVRKAMQMALDLETINNVFFKGYGDTTPHGQQGDAAIGYFVPFEEWPAELKEAYDYAPEGAEALLDEAGLPRGADGMRFSSVYTVLDRYDPSYYELLAGYWRDIGVDVDVQMTPIGPFASKRRDYDFEMLSHEMAYGSLARPLSAPDRFLTTAAANSVAANDPDYDALFAAAAAATTIEEQQRWAKLADMYPVERHWAVWGPMNPSFEAFQPWIKGYNGELSGLGNPNYVSARLWIDSELKKSMGY